MGGGLPRADNAADRLACFRFSFRPSVNHQQQHRPNKCDSVPTITVRMRVGFTPVLQQNGKSDPVTPVVRRTTDDAKAKGAA